MEADPVLNKVNARRDRLLAEMFGAEPTGAVSDDLPPSLEEIAKMLAHMHQMDREDFERYYQSVSP